VLVFEDVHWAELALLELIQSLAGRIRGVPLLLVTLARPELLDRAPTWGGGLPRYSALPLEPLPEPDAERLARLLLSHDEEAVTLEELVRAGGGNPLFLEELAASVAERTTEAAATLPTTVQAIIAARLDALPAGERRVLQDASVVGRFFWRGALAAMSGDGAGLDDALDSLELRDFIRHQPTSRLEGDREFLFKHILTMEVAYETLPRAVRKERHATVAGYLERAAGDRVRESASLLGHHWRAAGESGRAVPHLLTAAEVASRAWAKDQAIALYGQAMELIDPDEDAGLLDRVVLDRARVRIERGELHAAVDELGPVLDRAQGHLLGLSLLARARAANWLVDAAGVHEYASRAADVAHEIGDVELEARSLAVLAEAAGMDGDPAQGVDIAARADGAWPPDRRDGDHAYTVAQAGLMQYWRGELADALALSQRGYELGTEASNVVATINGAAHTGLALTGLGRHEEAIGWLERAVALGADWEPQPRFGARAVNILAGTLREVGDLVGARELSERALEMTTKAAFPGGQVSARIDLLMLDILGGDLGRAERALPELMEAAEGTRGWHEWLWTVRLMEARAAIALAAGRWEDAVRTAEEAIARGARHGRAKYVCLSRTLHGRALAALGRAEDAATSLRTAVAEGETLGHPPTLWPALSALADTLEAAGAEAEAERVRDRAREAAQGFADSLSEGRRKLAVNLPDVAQVLGATP
jgi:tetratricopeptide (TPR) repeat protein